jgi:hypothetical protein
VNVGPRWLRGRGSDTTSGWHRGRRVALDLDRPLVASSGHGASRGEVSFAGFVFFIVNIFSEITAGIGFS